MISPNQQQQYIQLGNQVPGRACFLATNLINILVHTLILFEGYHSIGSSIIFLHIFVGYLITHYVLGVVSAIEQSQSLHKFYKISCAIISIVHLIVCSISLICVIVLASQGSSGNEFYALILVIYLMGLTWSGVELCIDYSNYKYISQLIASSSNQQFLGLPQSAYLNQTSFHQVALPQQNQVQVNQPYVLHYPQLQQQIPQQNFMEFKQQSFAYPIKADIMNTQNSVHKQPLMLQNGYPQFQ
ncbi:transmembrane protein, putative (macronuclear) [Tetrahymena thermophila SB210]|uniref:Transmembrane protein, putative n=1 Tax=Tetrahymena thermophila (strain SB210) TaxID=312017 RepID=Q240J3_TETTS|nr:transmembrane protein, putative [Tetrahymena thermophila SB210]EAS02215.1 transmembrane protein, putative [Tetrahymena thermophila SB210]|eukprot:XP_001022460.1 transmembrane protein, putative [Tetrahymena thermophila SB210]